MVWGSTYTVASPARKANNRLLLRVPLTIFQATNSSLRKNRRILALICKKFVRKAQDSGTWSGWDCWTHWRHRVTTPGLGSQLS